MPLFRFCYKHLKKELLFIATAKQNVASRVLEIITPIAKEQGLDIWDVRYLKEGASYFLRIFIDKEEGINIDDCENFSRAIDEPLDNADPIKEPYFLEVSSPGLNRELIKEEHFKAFIGEEVILKLYKAIDKQKEFMGVLKNYENGDIIIEYNGEDKQFLKADIAKVIVNDLDF